MAQDKQLTGRSMARFRVVRLAAARIVRLVFQGRRELLGLTVKTALQDRLELVARRVLAGKMRCLARAGRPHRVRVRRQIRLVAGLMVGRRLSGE